MLVPGELRLAGQPSPAHSHRNSIPGASYGWQANLRSRIPFETQ
jgi:hypothetical protein